jgi:hypothetical protein
VRPLWAPPVDATVDQDHAGHGGADARMLAAIFDSDTRQAADRATVNDGAMALATGLAANESFETGFPVRIGDILAGDDGARSTVDG